MIGFGVILSASASQARSEVVTGATPSPHEQTSSAGETRAGPYRYISSSKGTLFFI